MAARRTDLGRLIGAAVLLAAIGLCGGCSKPEREPWKAALKKGDVIPLPKSVASDRPQPGDTADEGAQAGAEAEKFVLPPPPPLTAPPALENANKGSDARASEHPREPKPEKKLDRPKPSTADQSDPPSGPSPSHGSGDPSASASGASTKQDDLSTLSLGEVVGRLRKKLEEIEGYSADLIKQERVGNAQRERQTIRILAHRPSGRILLDWLDTNRAGRRIAIDKTDPKGELKIRVGPKEPRLFGETFKLPANHFLVRMGNRHPVSKLGLEAWITNLEQVLRRNEAGDHSGGVLELLGPREGPESRTFIVVRQKAGPGASAADLPEGSRRDWFIDPELWLPTMVSATGPDGVELEHYRLRNLAINPGLSPDDLLIDPSKGPESGRRPALNQSKKSG